MRVLGLSGHFHDAAAALVVDGRMVAAAQEERFSRRKHDASMPVRSAAFCLRQGGMVAADLDAIVWHEKPLLKFERILQTSLRTWPAGLRAFRRAMISMVGDKLWVKDHLAKEFGVPESKILFSGHHTSHAASAFYCSPFSEAAVLCVDGVGEWATTSTWKASRSGGLVPMEEIHFPHSLGLLYSVFTAFLGFEVNDGECKIMGLAGYGKPRFMEELRKVVKVGSDGAFELVMDHFCFHVHPDRSWNPSFEAIFGAPRAVGAPMEDRHRDLAATIQLFTEEQMLGLARRIHASTGAKHLCLAGGVALNAVAVGRIEREGPFEKVFVQPAAGDAGAALGGALFVGGGEHAAMTGSGWGEGIDVDAARSFFTDGGVQFTELDEDKLVEAVAGRLDAGEVVGWMQGRFEWGPRALGHRSILADGRLPDVRERLNTRVKFREPFRPFAPSVLPEDAASLFDLHPAGEFTRPFMTTVVPAKDDRVPSAVHVDHTARIQVVDPAAEPLYTKLLLKFKERSGLGCVVNTSFNLAGEPIVNTPADGWATFARCGMDALAVGPFLVTRSA